MAVDSPGSPTPTVGLEWELATVNPETFSLTPRGDDLIHRVHTAQPQLHLEPEFLTNTVEVVTGIHDTVPHAVAELEQARAAMVRAAGELGVGLWAGGCHPTARWQDQDIGTKPAHQEILDRGRYWARQMLIWGLHAHVGVSSKEVVWPVINAVMTHYGAILAASASSPAWSGEDTGYASHRSLLYQQLPTAGVPYGFSTWEEYQCFMEDQRRSGVISHTGAMHFDVRPTAFGTIELRIADTPSNLVEVRALAALMHSLVVYYDRAARRGAQLPSLQPWFIKEDKWRAARYGMDAQLIVGRDCREQSVPESLNKMVDMLGPTAQELGCGVELEGVLDIITRGAGYQRQRKVYEATGSWQAVAAFSSAETMVGRPLRTGEML